MPPEKFNVGLVQMSMTSDPDQNLQHAIERVREAAGRGAQIVCLPELFQTQYFCQREDCDLFDLAEPIPGPTSVKLGEVAKQLRVVLIASLFEKRAAGVYHNTAAMFDADGTLRGLYRKMHIPDDPLYYEKYYFTPGDLGFRAFDTNVGRVGTLVCWDQWYPEGARLTALQGATCAFLSDGNRMASRRKSRMGCISARCLADDSESACHRQWRICGRGQSRWFRNRGYSWQSCSGRRTGILGWVILM